MRSPRHDRRPFDVPGHEMSGPEPSSSADRVRRPGTVARALVVGALAWGLVGCGGEPEQIAAQDRCAKDDLSAYSEGKVGSLALDFDREEVEGSITTHEVSVKIGTARGKSGELHPVIMRIFDAKSSENLLDVIANATGAGPVELAIVDASDIGAGGQNRTDLTRFGCSIGDGTICVQVGIDTNGDGLLLNGDEAAFNAASGSLTLRDVDNRRRKVMLDWQVELGPNILTFGDDSSGAFDGCLHATYEHAGVNYWAIR